jgi:hypothetical protein
MSGENGTVEESNVDGLDETDALAGPDIVILEDEEGNAMDFALLAIVEVEDQDYALMTPAEQIEDDGGDSMELFLFQYDEEDDGTASFSEIDDEETYERVRDFCATLVDMEDVEVDTSTS